MNKKRSEEVKKVALGRFQVTRPRPTYAVPVAQDWQERATYPKSNSRRISSTATVHWKLGAWRNVDGSYEGVQVRGVRAAAYEAGALACYFTVTQTRNNTAEEMSIGAYALTCDDESQELGHHAEVVQEALARYESRDWLWPSEATTELSTLFVPPAFKNKMLWRPAMATVLKRLASQNEGAPQVCVLKAMPLETAWRLQALSEDEWERSRRGQASQSAQPSKREDELAKRRASALRALYERELGFEPLLEPWMARMVEPPLRRKG